MDEPILLHLETSSERGSVAISKANTLLSYQEMEAAYQHAAQINGLIMECMKAVNLQFEHLDGISVGSGPGSYTALRVGASTAKGIAYSLDIPLIVIPTLFGLAHRMAVQAEKTPEAVLVPMLDARRNDVYTATFDSQLKEIRKPEMITLSDNYLDGLGNKKIWVAGSGSTKALQLLDRPIIDLEIQVSAKWHIVPAMQLWTSKSYTDPAYFSPNYITAPNITQPKKRL